MATSLLFAAGESEQKYSLRAGASIRKTLNFYTENGAYVTWSQKALFDHGLYFQLEFLTSRLGSAWSSNALMQESWLLGAGWKFLRHYSLNPVVEMHFGYFSVDYENPVFDVLDNTSWLWTLSTGLSWNWEDFWGLRLLTGYNMITHDGTSGPGSIYPLFLKFQSFWNFSLFNDRNESLEPRQGDANVISQN